MTRDPLYVPNELMNVEICYQKWISNPADIKLRERFVLNMTLFDPSVDDDEEVRLALTRYRLKLFEFHVQNPEVFGFYVDDLDTYLNDIAEYKQTKDLLGNGELARILACLCIERAAKAAARVRTMLPNVSEIVKEWTGLALTIEQSESVQSLTELLFSPAAWSLLRADVDADGEFASRLCELKIPALAAVPNAEKEKTRLPECDLHDNTPR